MLERFIGSDVYKALTKKIDILNERVQACFNYKRDYILFLSYLIVAKDCNLLISGIDIGLQQLLESFKESNVVDQNRRVLLKLIILEEYLLPASKNQAPLCEPEKAWTENTRLPKKNYHALLQAYVRLALLEHIKNELKSQETVVGLNKDTLLRLLDAKSNELKQILTNINKSNLSNRRGVSFGAWVVAILGLAFLYANILITPLLRTSDNFCRTNQSISSENILHEFWVGLCVLGSHPTAAMALFSIICVSYLALGMNLVEFVNKELDHYRSNRASLSVSTTQFLPRHSVKIRFLKRFFKNRNIRKDLY